MTIADGAFFRNGFRANGVISMVGAKINGALVIKHANIAEAILDMRNAIIKTLIDDSDSWPASGNLHLIGFRYDDIGDDSPTDKENRLGWLRRVPKEHFSPQPYEQLAEVLRRSGHDEEAKQVLIAKWKDRVSRGPKMSIGLRLWYFFFGLVSDYGYRPSRALGWMFGIVFLGWGLFGWGSHHQAMEALGNPHPEFSAFLYSLDTFLPLVDLYQADFWHPLPSFLIVYLCFHVIMGWVLTTFLIQGLIRLIRS